MRRAVSAMVAISLLSTTALAATAPPIVPTANGPTQAIPVTPYDASGNVIGAGGGTTGGATPLCTGQIKATATACGSAAAHGVYDIVLDNTLNSAETWFQIFDVAVGSVTLGTTVPGREIGVAPGAEMVITPSVGWSFTNQITLACTTTPTGLTAPTNICAYTVDGQ